MKTYPSLVACEHCDSVYRRHALRSHEVARCDECHAVLYRPNRTNVNEWLALTIAAGIVFVVANTNPVIRISLQGVRSETTLWRAAAALAHGAAAPIAVPTALAIVVVPFIQIVLLAWLLTFAHARQRAPGFAWAMRMLGALRPWSMIEVGLLAILVAIIKLSSFAQVAPGPGAWATAALLALTALIAGRDIRWLWKWTDSIRECGTGA